MQSVLEDSELRGLADADVARRILAAAPALDEPAETELCRRFGPRIRLYGLKHLRSAAAAADLVQDVLVIALEALRAGRLREPEKLASFVLGTCRRVVVDQRRRDRRRESLLNRFADSMPEPADGEHAPQAGVPEHTARLAQCLERLSERARAVLLMSFYDERPAPAVAAELGLSPANVRVIRHRSLARLQDCMGEVAGGRMRGAAS